MKKYILGFGMVMVILVLAIFHRPEPVNDTQMSGNLAELTKAAFFSLDSKVSSGIPMKFNYEIEDPESPVAPLFDNLGDHHFPVSTDNDRAQQYFDQGIRLAYAFNHAESHRSFLEASRLDPQLAMAFWGQAYALSPNINDPFPDEQRRKKGYEAIRQAIERLPNASTKEKDLILALEQRYSADTDTDLADLNLAYMKAMESVVKKYPEDADIQTLYAASVMNTMPWNYWDGNGNPNPGTLDGKKALERAIELDPQHPGAHHYYIHMVELPKPDLAVPSADILGDLMPAAGHLVHMPSHIYIRVGRYHDAAKANIEAIKADEDYISQCYSQGMYPLGYYPHNIHFLWSSASLLGNSETALAAAKKTAEKVPVGQMDALTFLQDYFSTPMLSYVRFGKWNEILTIPNPGPSKHVVLVWHYARGIAFVRKDNIKEAEEELAAIESLMKDPELETLIANYTNPSSNIARVAHRVVAGEIEAAKGNYDEAVRLLKEGVEFEDELTYSEPPAWHVPVRQTLGAVLLDAGMPEEAEKTYRRDLEKFKNNGWSLIGLYNSLVAQGRNDEASKVKKEFDKAWAEADIEITSSIL